LPCGGCEDAAHLLREHRRQQSSGYQVDIVEPPVIVKRAIVYDFPSYTRAAGWLDRTDEDTNGDVRAPADTIVTLRLTTNKPIKSGLLQMGSGQQPKLKLLDDPKQQEATFVVEKDGVYSVQMEDVDGIANPDQRENKITALRDRAPAVEFRSPAKTSRPARRKREAGHRVKDDYGLTELRLVARRGKDGPQKVIQTWKEFATPREATIPFTWDLASAGEKYQAGDELFYYAVALDNHAELTGGREVAKPQESKTGEFKITIEDKEKLAVEKAKAFSNWETELRRVLETRSPPGAAWAALDKQQDLDILHKEGGEIQKISDRCVRPHGQRRQGDEGPRTSRPSGEGEHRAAGLWRDDPVRRAASTIPKAPSVEAARQAFGTVATAQDKIIKVLRQLLNILPDMPKARTRIRWTRRTLPISPMRTRRKMKDLLKNLKDMVRQQKKAVETTDDVGEVCRWRISRPRPRRNSEDVKAIRRSGRNSSRRPSRTCRRCRSRTSRTAPCSKNSSRKIQHRDRDGEGCSCRPSHGKSATALEDTGLGLATSSPSSSKSGSPTPLTATVADGGALTDGYETPMAELPKELRTSWAT